MISAQFVAAGDRVCGTYPPPLSDYVTAGGENVGDDGTAGAAAVSAAAAGRTVSGASAPETPVRDLERYVVAVEGFVAKIERLDLPDGAARRPARAFVESVERLGPAIDHVKAATARVAATSPTETMDVGKAMAGLGTAFTQLERLVVTAGRAARAGGLRACRVVLAAHIPPAGAEVPGQARLVEIEPPAVLSAAGAATFLAGRSVATRSGCLACHRIGAAGNAGPGPALTVIGARLPSSAIARELRDPLSPMPSYSGLPRRQFDSLVAFLSYLRG